jgi:secreted trypsin-like serine protease
LKRIVTLLAGAVAALTLLATPAGAITGSFVQDNEHPYVGLIVFYDVDPATGRETFLERCSGSLLTDRVFLTAGHCLSSHPDLARIWFEQDAGVGLTPGVSEDPATGYPVRCHSGDPLCVTSTTMFDYGFTGSGPNTHDAGLVILPDATPVSLSEYGQLARDGFLNTIATQRGKQNVTFTLSGYGISSINPNGFTSFRERLMSLTTLVNLSSHIADGYNLQVSAAPAPGKSWGGQCKGDSGGPMLYGSYPSNTITAIVSFGLNSWCQGTGFGYRTDRQELIAWILDTVTQAAPGEQNEIVFTG